jgi:ABC-type sugar transport system ATPase subunit
MKQARWHRRASFGPQEARQKIWCHGINAVHQEVVLCPHLSVAANLFLGDERVRLGLPKHGEMIREAQKILDEIGFKLSGSRSIHGPCSVPSSSPQSITAQTC